MITVAAPAGVPSYDMNVTDMTGRVVYSGKVNTPGKYNAKLNVSNGVYVVDIISGSTSISKKVMICN